MLLKHAGHIVGGATTSAALASKLEQTILALERFV